MAHYLKGTTQKESNFFAPIGLFRGLGLEFGCLLRNCDIVQQSLIYKTCRRFCRVGKERMSDSLNKTAICSFVQLIYHEQPERIAHICSFVMSVLSDSLIVAHLSWAIWSLTFAHLSWVIWAMSEWANSQPWDFDPPVQKLILSIALAGDYFVGGQ